MTENRPTARVVTALVCDDARREDNKKEILIGVYTGGILVEKFPSRLALCLWTLVQTSGEGELSLEFRVVDSEDTALIAGEGMVSVANSDEPSSLVFPKMPLKVEKATTLRFQLKPLGGNWETIAEKSVRLRPNAAETSPAA